MPSSYTNSLRLTLPVTGELTGSWGDTVNTGITDLVDAAVAGTATVTHTDAADYTLTVVSGAVDESRQMVLNIVGTLTAARNVVCPAVSKLYLVKNATTGGFPITLKTSSGTGITVPNGQSMFLYCDSVNVVSAVSYVDALASASLATDSLTVGSNGFNVVASGTKMYFKFGATNLASIDSSGNFVVLANVTAYSTP